MTLAKRELFAPEQPVIVLKLLIGIALAALVFRVGFWMLKGLAVPVNEPPPEGEMRKINLRFRCSICGAEVRMTAAPNQEPEPPRHCLEDMELLAPLIE
jgi:hypothetical protein